MLHETHRGGAAESLGGRADLKERARIDRHLRIDTRHAKGRDLLRALVVYPDDHAGHTVECHPLLDKCRELRRQARRACTYWGTDSLPSTVSPSTSADLPSKRATARAVSVSYLYAVAYDICGAAVSPCGIGTRYILAGGTDGFGACGASGHWSRGRAGASATRLRRRLRRKACASRSSPARRRMSRRRRHGCAQAGGDAVPLAGT